MQNPIEQYLKNCKPNASKNEDVQSYLDRIIYYQKLLETEPPVEKALGYGVIPFEVDRKGMKNMLDFWLNAMIWFIETEGVREYKKKKQKEKK